MADDSLLADPHRLRGDLQLLGRAIKKRWPTGDDKKAGWIARLEEIVEKRSVDVPTKEGVETSDEAADKNAISAVRILVAMEGQNQSDEQHASGATVHHEHVHAAIVDTRRSDLDALAARLAGRARQAGGGAVIEVTASPRAASGDKRTKGPLGQRNKSTKRGRKNKPKRVSRKTAD